MSLTCTNNLRSTRVHDEYIFDSVYLEWRDPVTEPPLHFFTLSKCIQNIHTRYQQPTTLGMNMPIPESRNPRLVSRLGASRSSCNSKDPPESGSRGIPDSREALQSESFTRVTNASTISSFARNWERSESKNGRLGMMNGIDGRQNGMKFSKDCWKPSKAREDMGERGPRHPLLTPVHPNLK